MTRFFFDLQLYSHARDKFILFDGECEGQCFKEANATMQILANGIIDNNPDWKFQSPSWVLRPCLEIVKNEQA